MASSTRRSERNAERVRTSVSIDIPEEVMERIEIEGFQVYRFTPDHPEPSLSSRPCLFFAHATGIAAQTYAHLLQRWARAWGVTLYAFDMRGHGETELPLYPAYAQGRTRVSQCLLDDMCRVFWGLKEREAAGTRWIFSGHSLGGWLALFAACRCFVSDCIVFDIALFPTSQAALWAAACAVGQRRLHFLSAPARRRKRRFGSHAEAVRVFARTPFFRGWPKERIDAYIQSNFEERDGLLWLRHDPDWEADIFESQPPSTAWTVLRVPLTIRNALNVVLIAGSASQVCHPSARPAMKLYFPNTRWEIVPKGGHMFPFESEEATLAHLVALMPHFKISAPIPAPVGTAPMERASQDLPQGLLPNAS